MLQRKKITSVFNDILLFLSLIFCFVSVFGFSTSLTAFAEGRTTYSGVLSDLKKATNFKESDYPVNNEDYSLKVIQVAESTEKDVFVYVYQPCQQLRATSINMSLQKNDMRSSKLYSLDYLNSNGVFFKYKIRNLTASGDIVRHYNISAIYRKYYSNIDTDITDPNITERAYNVSMCFSISKNVDDTYLYCNSATETVEVTTKWSSFIRYKTSTSRGQQDVFFVAFDTDRQIDDLIEADIAYSYYTYDCYKNYVNSGDDSGLIVASISAGHYSDYDHHNHSSSTSVEKTLNSSSQESVVFGKWLFKTKYTWNQIESVKDFISDKDKNLSNDSLKKLSDKKWVLNFYQAPYEIGTEYVMASPFRDYERGSVVNDDVILRLKFETAGTTYNLGVIDNKQDSETKPAGISSKETIMDRVKKIAIIIGIVLLSILALALLSPVLPVIFTFIGKAIKYICIGLWYVIKYAGIGLWYVIKYLGLGIYYFFAWPFIVYKKHKK